MGRTIHADDLVAASDIAERVGVTTRAVLNWNHHPDYPPVIVVVGSVRLWSWLEVAAWLRRHDRHYVTAEVPDIAAHYGWMTAANIQELRNWKQARTAWTLIHRAGNFPGPVRKVGAVWVWDRDTVLDWHQRNPRKRNRRSRAIAERMALRQQAGTGRP